MRNCARRRPQPDEYERQRREFIEERTTENATRFDAPWKLAVERFLQPLLQLGSPAAHDSIDWRHPPEFLDTELQALGTEQAQGGRTADKLVKVLDLRGAEEVFERTGNPFALVVAAQQVALATRSDALARYAGRWGIVRRLRWAGLERRELQDLLRVIQVLTRMPPELEFRFKCELATSPPSEGHITTELITPLKEIAMEEGFAKGQAEGLAKGRDEGRVEGLVDGLLNVLESRFGAVPEGVRDQLKQVSDESRLRQAMRLAVTEPTLERFLAKL